MTFHWSYIYFMLELLMTERGVSLKISRVSVYMYCAPHNRVHAKTVLKQYLENY